MTLISLMCGFLGIRVTHAATISFVSDALSRHAVGLASDHEITFTTPSGVHSPTSTIVIAISGFDFSQIVASDIALTHGPSTGLEIVESVASTAAAGVWGENISGSQMTLTPPTNATTNEIAANQIVRIRIGTNSGGTHQIINPSSAGSYQGSINGGFGDRGTFGVVVVTNDQIVVTAEVQSGTTGGHTQPPSDTTPPVIVSVLATSTSPTSATIEWTTSEGSTSAVDFGQTNSYTSGTVSDSNLIYQHSVDLIDLAPCTVYVYQVRSSDAEGNEAISSNYSFKTVCDTTAPVISNVHADQVTDSQAVILWTTSEPASSRVEYGVGGTYLLSSETSGYVTNHSLPISGLLPNTAYSYRVISTDVSGNTSISTGWVFVTSHDMTPPTNVMLTATPGDGLVVLQWSAPLESDVIGIVIVRRTDRFPTNANDGAVIYSGSQLAVTDPGLTNGTTYYYGAFVYDAAGNYSSGSLASATPEKGALPPVIPPIETTSTPPVIPPVETTSTTPVVPPTETSSTTPVIPGQPTEGATIDFEFYGSHGTMPLSINDQGMIGTRGNAGITVRVPVSSLNGAPRYVVVIVGDFIVQLQLNRAKGYYEGTFSVPTNATVAIKGQALYTDGRVAERNYVFQGYSYGTVTQSPLFGTGMIPVPDAEITLYRQELGAWVIWNGAEYGQANPQRTTANGMYLFEVPSGQYYAEIKKEGYESKKTNPLYISNNVFNEKINLVYIPKSLRELLEAASSTSPVAKMGIVAQTVASRALYEMEKVREYFAKPQVQDVNTQIIAPSALIISAFNAVAAASVFQWITYLQYLFTQPFLLLWRRKRQRYGVIYNSLTKKPVDLCIVRLVHADTGLVVQTRVTDRQGRYFFYVKKGDYRLEIIKPHFEFPSQLVNGKKSDDEYLDVYDGGIVRIKDDGAIATNVPIDPMVKEQTPTRIRFRKGLRRIQHGMAYTSIAASIVGLVVTPTVPMALGVVSQFVIYSIFKRLMIPDQPKRWGFVYDARTLKPITNAVIRLYDEQYERLLETQLSNTKGQYGFLVGKNVYSLTVEAKGYEPATIHHIDLMKKEDSAVDMVVSLKKISKDSQKKSDMVKNWKK